MKMLRYPKDAFKWFIILLTQTHIVVAYCYCCYIYKLHCRYVRANIIVNCVQSFMHMKILLKCSNSVSVITLYIFSLCYFRILDFGGWGGGWGVSRHVFGNFTMWISGIWIFQGEGYVRDPPPHTLDPRMIAFNFLVKKWGGGGGGVL